MRAVVQWRYGGPEVLRLEEIEPPKIPDDRVLVRVKAASVNALDWHMMRGMPLLARMDGFRGPRERVRGVDVAGVVESVGAAVTRFVPGDEVFGGGGGTFAELARSKETSLVHKPTNLSFEEAAAVPVAGLTALQGLRDAGGVRAGRQVLVYGAGGGVGSYAVQIARALGATVTAVTRTDMVDLVRSLGAERVIDHTREDVTRLGETWDVVFDLGGNRSLTDLRRATVPGGVVVLCGAGRGDTIGPLVRIAAGRIRTWLGRGRFVFYLAQHRQDDLLALAHLLGAGQIRPIIDRAFPLERAGEAIAYVEQGRARGKVVITI